MADYLKGLIVAFSGTPAQFTREDAAAMVHSTGGKAYGSVSAKVDLLVVGDRPGVKFSLAKELGILIITEDEFLDLIRNGNSRPIAQSNRLDVEPVDGFTSIHSVLTAWRARLSETRVAEIVDIPAGAIAEMMRATGGKVHIERELQMRERVLPPERIIAAAIQVEGVTISLPLPARHGQVLHAAEAMGLPSYAYNSACQGFLTSEGRFVNRVQAKQIAHMAGQPQLRPEAERHGRDLFSEDLW